MDVFDRFKRVLLRQIYILFVVFFLIFISSYSFGLFNLTSPFSIFVMITAIAMLIGQVLLLTPFGFSYPFYVFSFTVAIAISLLIWLPYHISNPELGIPIYIGLVALLIAGPFTTHWLTKKRIGTFPMIPIFSIFFLGLLMVLSNSKTVSSTTYDSLFLLTIVLFILTSILGLNMAYRTMVLNVELKINDRNQYLRKTKEELLKKHTSTDARADIDLLTYYLSSSLDSFVYGDFDRSYMDAFKILDNQGTAFKTICTLSIKEDQWKRLKDIRNKLSHARITEGKKEEIEEKEDFEN